MPYEILEHTADARMVVRGDSPEGLFEEAVNGMMALMVHEAPDGEVTQKRKLTVESLDQTALLVDFLSEVLTLAHTHKEVYTKVTFTEFSKTVLTAELEGVAIDGFDRDVKAVTYHEADVVQTSKGEWETNLVFDV